MSTPPAGPERCPRCGAESPCTDWDSVDLGVGIQSFNYEWTCPTHGEFVYVSDDAGPVDFTAGRPAVRTSVRPVFRNDPEEPR